MKLSCLFLPGPRIVEHAKCAESLGYDRVWSADSPALYSDVWVALARVAEHTEGVGLGVAVVVPSNRHVLATAAAIAGIEEMAPGRLAVAVGTGFTARMMLGQRPLTWKVTRQYVSDLRALLRGEDVEVEGARVKLCHPRGFSSQPPLPTSIVVAANGPRGLAVARELGDGVMSVVEPIPDFDWSAMLVMGTVFDPGEDFSSPRVFETLGPAIAVVYHGIYEASGEGVDALPNGKAWREEMEKIPEAVRHLAIHEDHFVRVNDRDRPFLDPVLGATTLSGAPEALRERIKGLEQAGLTELVYTPMGDDIERELCTMAEVVGI